jgi:hypothetical protein
VERIQFDGNDPNQINVWTDYAIVEGAYADDITFRGCGFINPTIIGARVFRTGERWTVDRCRFVVNDHVGLRTEMEQFQIANSTFYGSNTNSGVLMTIATNADVGIQGDGAIVSGCMFERGLIQLSTGGMVRSVIHGNTFRDQIDNAGVCMLVEPYDAALSDYGTEYNVIAHNVLYNCRRGISLTSSAAVAALYNMYQLIHGNQISSMSICIFRALRQRLRSRANRSLSPGTI